MNGIGEEPKPCREPLVFVEIERLHQQSEVLHKQLDELFNRLTPVLSPPEISEGVIEDKKEMQVAPLVKELTNIRNNLGRLSLRIDEISQRLEI